jgi:hypothetical protein
MTNLANQFVGRIDLAPLEIAALLLFLAVAVVRARPEWILGAYLSMTLWTRAVVIGDVSQTWVILAALALATIRYVHRERHFAFTPEYLGRRSLGLFPAQGRWIALWMLLWWGWIALVLFQFDAESKIAVLRPILLNIIAPLPVMLVIARDLDRLRGFALAYVLATVIGCYLALRVYGIPLSYLLTDPGLSRTGLVRLGVRNYHFFSHFCAIGFILATTLYLDAKRLPKQGLMLLCAAWCAYFVLLAGARQSMSAAVVVTALILIWTVTRGHLAMGTRGLVLAAVITVLVTWLYQIAPQLVLREDDGGNIANSFNIFADRGRLWLLGWSFFLRSPVWGLGFEQTVYSHNLFIGTLADQGLVGMLFFAGYLIFVAQRLPSVFGAADRDPRDLWRVACLGIFLFGVIHGMAAGNSSSTAHLFWPIAALWWLGQDIPRPAPRPITVGSVRGQPIFRSPFAGRSPNP